VGGNGRNIPEDSIWKNLERCVGHTVDRDHLERLDGDQDGQTKDIGSKRFRACFNGDRAPHNLEGFFLHFGDVPTKRQEPCRAHSACALAKSSTTWASWPYAGILGDRMKSVDARAGQFRSAKTVTDEPKLTARAGYFCVSCHQRGAGTGR